MARRSQPDVARVPRVVRMVWKLASASNATVLHLRGDTPYHAGSGTPIVNDVKRTTRRDNLEVVWQCPRWWASDCWNGMRSHIRWWSRIRWGVVLQTRIATELDESLILDFHDMRGLRIVAELCDCIQARRLHPLSEILVEVIADRSLAYMQNSLRPCCIAACSMLRALRLAQCCGAL